MLSLIELHYLIKELNFYEKHIVERIKYFYECELNFVKQFKKYLHKHHLLKKYYLTFIKDYYQYNDAEIFLYTLTNKKNNHNKINFQIHMYYDYDDIQDTNEMKCFRYCLNLYEVIEIMILHYKQNRTKPYNINLEKLKPREVLFILLEKNNIYLK